MGRRRKSGRVRVTKLSDASIKLKSGFDNDTLENRRETIISWIQKAWPLGIISPDIEQPQNKWQCYWKRLHSLMNKFDDRNFWPGWGTDSGKRERLQLDTYTAWAIYLDPLDESKTSRKAKSMKLQATQESPCQSSSNEECSLSESKNSDWRPSSSAESSCSEDEPRAIKKRKITRSTAKLPAVRRDNSPGTPERIAWDIIEVHIDATDLGERNPVLIPMADLKPQIQKVHISWNQFNLVDLCSRFTAETGKEIDMSEHEFCYNVGELVFSRPGAYKIMLKRFAEGQNPNDNILHLRVRKQTPVEQERQGVKDSLVERHRSRPRVKIEDNDEDNESIEGMFPLTEREKIKMEKQTK